jgi:hypothetical protein
MAMSNDAPIKSKPGADGLEPVTRDEAAALRAIVEGTARQTGQEFFQSLMCSMLVTGPREELGN